MSSFPTATEHSAGERGGEVAAASSAFTLSEAATRGILWKDVLKNFSKFLRTPFLQNTSEELLLSFIKFR